MLNLAFEIPSACCFLDYLAFVLRETRHDSASLSHTIGRSKINLKYDVLDLTRISLLAVVCILRIICCVCIICVNASDMYTGVLVAVL